jgi:ABC-type amino acid transport substrate-binding protein
MMHVPVDPDWAKKNDKVRIFAPYYRERLVVARDRARIPHLVGFDALASERIGVQNDTLEDNYLSNAMGGSLRDRVVHFATTAEAAAALRRGEVAAVMGAQSYLEGALRGASDSFAVAPVVAPGLPTYGWDVGVATAVEKAIAEIRADGTLERIFTARGLTYATPKIASNP